MLRDPFFALNHDFGRKGISYLHPNPLLSWKGSVPEGPPTKSTLWFLCALTKPGPVKPRGGLPSGFRLNRGVRVG